MPVYDYMKLLAQMKFDYKNVTFDGETGYIFGANTCSHYKFDTLTFGIGNLDFEVPMMYYTREVKGKCQLMIEMNQDHRDPNYYLGGPFLRAFMVLLDIDKNRIGFAKKVKNFGAEILGPDKSTNLYSQDSISSFAPKSEIQISVVLAFLVISFVVFKYVV